jgi:hypothetical protein
MTAGAPAAPPPPQRPWSFPRQDRAGSRRQPTIRAARWTDAEHGQANMPIVGCVSRNQRVVRPLALSSAPVGRQLPEGPRQLVEPSRVVRRNPQRRVQAGNPQTCPDILDFASRATFHIREPQSVFLFPDHRDIHSAHSGAASSPAATRNHARRPAGHLLQPASWSRSCQ